jgi:GH24 family phage-related lysozyme (muramidase)
MVGRNLLTPEYQKEVAKGRNLLAPEYQKQSTPLTPHEAMRNAVIGDLSFIGKVGKPVLQDIGKGAIEGVVGRATGILQAGASGLQELGVEGLEPFQDSARNVATKLKNLGKGTGVAGAAGEILADPVSLASMGVSLPLKAGSGLANVGTRTAQRIGYGAAGGAFEGATAPVTEEGQRAENIAFGATLGGGIGAVMSSPAIAVARAAKDKVKQTLAPKSRDTIEARAAGRAQELVPEAEDIAVRLGEESITNLTPARLTNDAGLESLEAIAMKDPVRRLEFQQKQMEALNAIRQEYSQLQKQGAPEDAMTLVRERAQSTIDKLSNRSRTAEEQLQAALNAVDLTISPANISLAARDKIAKARAAAVEEGSRLYQQVPNIPINPGATRKAFDDLLKNTPVAQMSDIPKDLMESVLNLEQVRNAPTSILDVTGTIMPRQIESSRRIDVREMQGLRSKLMEQSAIAKAAGNKKQSYILDNLSDAVMTDLEQIAAQTGDESLRIANNFWRTRVKEPFDQGVVGDVTRADRDRGVAVAEELTLENLLGAGKGKGNVGIDRLLKAAPEALPEAQSYMLALFRDKAIKENGLNVAQANKFLRDNRDILDRVEFANVKEGINNVIKAQEKYIKTHDRQKAITDALTGATERTLIGRQRISATSRFINADVDNALDGFIKNNDMRGLRNLKATVAKDKTGAAQTGLRSAMIHKIIGDGSSGKAILANLNNPSIVRAAKQLLPEEQVARLQRLAREQEAWQRSVQDSVAGGKLVEPNMLMQALFQILGAKTASKVKYVTGINDTGGSFAVSGFFGKNAKRLAERFGNGDINDLLMEATMDRDLMKLLLTRPATETQKKALEKSVNIWLQTNAGRLQEEERGIDDAYSPLRQPMELYITPQNNIFFEEVPIRQSDYTQQNEGFRSAVYRDTYNNPTVGYGFNFSSGIAPKVWKQAGFSAQDYNRVKRGEALLSKEAAQRLYMIGMQIAEKDARAYYQDFDKLAEPQRQALRDMSFQMGGNALKQFRGLHKALKENNANAIVNAIKKSEYYRQTPERALRNAKLLLQGIR